MKDLLIQARRVAEQMSESAGGAATAALSAVPSASDVKRGLGPALILGGRALIDPRAVVGEMAVSLGQSLVNDARADRWLTLVPEGEGFAAVAHGDEALARAAMRLAVEEGRPAMLCQVAEAADSAVDPQVSKQGQIARDMRRDDIVE